MTKTKKPPRKPPAVPKLMDFSGALTAIKAGKLVQRMSWHPSSRLGRMGGNVFVILPAFINAGVPQKWQPYPNDILANDWQVAA